MDHSGDHCTIERERQRESGGEAVSGRGTVTVRVRMCVENGLNYSDTSERMNGDTDGEMHCTEESRWWIQKDI